MNEGYVFELVTNVENGGSIMLNIKDRFEDASEIFHQKRGWSICPSVLFPHCFPHFPLSYCLSPKGH